MALPRVAVVTGANKGIGLAIGMYLLFLPPPPFHLIPPIYAGISMTTTRSRDDATLHLIPATHPRPPPCPASNSLYFSAIITLTIIYSPLPGSHIPNILSRPLVFEASGPHRIRALIVFSPTLLNPSIVSASTTTHNLPNLPRRLPRPIRTIPPPQRRRKVAGFESTQARWRECRDTVSKA